MTQVWSATQINTHLTGGGTTTVTQGGTNVESRALGSEGFTTGKFYWEAKVTTSDFSHYSTFGAAIGNTNTSIADNPGIHADVCGVIYGGSGTNVYFYWNQTVVWNSSDFGLVSGDVYGNALDLVNGLYWVNAVTQGTGWYGASNVGNGNPATGTNGFNILQAGSTITSYPVVPAISLYINGDVGVGYFAPSSWAGVAPSGFGPFDPFAVFSDLGGASERSLAVRSGNERRRTVWS